MHRILSDTQLAKLILAAQSKRENYQNFKLNYKFKNRNRKKEKLQYYRREKLVFFTMIFPQLKFKLSKKISVHYYLLFVLNFTFETILYFVYYSSFQNTF